MSKVTTITYQRTIPTGAYSNCKIGLEASLDSGDFLEIEMENLKKKVDDLYKSLHPEPFDEMTGTVVKDIPKMDKKTAMECIIEDINTCKELKVLESYRLIAAGNAEIKKAYNNKFKSLQNGL